ncbi:MAG: hypothetical protein KatS3mg031_1036 [Chitinophagales bacterium]|nr:MAG: hypothetical protein KatS3mg031_1036 [Chitinophagales bacterium]
MKKCGYLLLILCSFTSAKGQLVSYSLMQSYTVQQLDSLLTALGIGVLIAPEYPIDFYKVIYMTPYRHPDSLVRASGAVMVPKNITCPAPMGSYFHGTTTNRTNVPSYNSREANIGILMASQGLVAALPDYLGLGDSDSSVIIHPYISAFHQGHSAVNLLRAARQLADTLGILLNGQLFLTGYSQGGFVTVATHKLIEESYSSEFVVTASAPMSGAYDFKKTMVDVMLSDSSYAAPAYLPYLLLGYHAAYPLIQQSFPDITKVFKSPYDTLLPPLFYNKNIEIGNINNLCDSVPKRMLLDSLVDAFKNDTMHPLRVVLAESHLLDWTPQAPVKLFYCRGDEQVTYLNAERAYDAWTTRGATQVEKLDLGNYTHVGCISFALIGATNYLLSFKDACTGVARNEESLQIKIYPNPSSGSLFVYTDKPGAILSLSDLSGRIIGRYLMEQTTLHVDLQGIVPGIYIARAIWKDGSKVINRKLVVQ